MHGGAVIKKVRRQETGLRLQFREGLDRAPADYFSRAAAQSGVNSMGKRASQPCNISILICFMAKISFLTPVINT